MKTKERLAATLAENGCPPEMVERAAAGYYDDFESELATPCVQLVTDLRELKKFALAKRAMGGEFDSTKEESEAWMEREGKALLTREPSLREAIESMGGTVTPNPEAPFVGEVHFPKKDKS